MISLGSYRYFNFEPSFNVLEIYLDHEFQRPQEGLNCESLAYKGVT